MRKTRIVGTLGPVSENKDVMKKIFQEGLNVARFNFSHGDHEEHGKRKKTVLQLNKELNTFVGTMLDTKGPEIRTNEFNGPTLIKKDSEVRIAFNEVLGNSEKFSVTYPGLYDDVEVGNTILVDDGYLELVITSKDAKNRELVTKAMNNHTVKSRRGINVPNVVLNMPFISEKDREDIIFGVENDYDFLALSFVRRREDIIQVKEILNDFPNARIQIIAKIENQEGLDNLEEIVDEADGIMVARGDLGVEIPGELVPEAQTEMIDLCLAYGKSVIVATQMLESMQSNPRPTRAEVSDVSNAVLEGTSATMLSGEMAAGDYPVESVNYMSRIDVAAEARVDYEYFLDTFYEPETELDLLSKAALQIVMENDLVDAILTDSYEQAESLSKFRPAVPVVVIVPTEKDARQLSLAYGVLPTLTEEGASKLLSEIFLDENSQVVNVIDGNVSLK